MSTTPVIKNHTEKDRGFVWADRLRILATLLVITIHVAAPTAHQNTEYWTWYWWSANLIDSFARPAVPLFVMLSGYLLLSKDYSIPVFLRRRYAKILLPWFFWSVVFLLYNHHSKNDPVNFGTALEYLVSNKVHYHLWYLYLTLGLYLTYPILRPWVRSAKEQEFWYFFVLCAIGTWLYKFLFIFYKIQIGIHFELFTNQTGTFILGYYLGTKLDGTQPERIQPFRISRDKLWWISVACIVVGSLWTMFGTWYFSQAQGKFEAYFYDYLTPNVGIASAGFFTFAYLTFQRGKLLDIEKAFVGASFGIYFTHVLVLDWWSRAGFWAYKFHPSYCIPVVVVLTAIGAFLFTSLIRSLPGGKKIA